MNVKQLRKILKKYKKKDAVVIAGDRVNWELVEAGYYKHHMGGIKIKGYDAADVHTVRLEL